MTPYRGEAMSDKSPSLETQLEDLREKQRRLKDEIRQTKDARRRARSRQRADLGLQPVDRPRCGNKFTATLSGQKIRQSLHLRVETLRRIQRLASERKLSLSEAIDSVLANHLDTLESTPADSVPANSSMADDHGAVEIPHCTDRRQGDQTEISKTTKPMAAAKYSIKQTLR